MTNKYDIIECIGEGAYGIVYKCKNNETGEFVAIKKFKDIDDENFRKIMYRELFFLKQIHHENIVQFKEAFQKKGVFYLVFEYVGKNLLELLEEHPNGLKPDIIKNLIFQLCKALKYLHKMGLVHRDIKPENLLITNDMKLKLCDFGFTRKLPKNSNEIMTDYVATRWYRAPELLITEGIYEASVDFWSVGCIMGELADGDPLFPGEDEFDQILCIQKVLGNFNSYLTESFYKNSLFEGKSLLDISKPETLEKRYLGKLPPIAISFMKGLLNIDYKKRLNCDTVFDHPYFDDLMLENNLSSFEDFQSNKNKINQSRNAAVLDYSINPTCTNSFLPFNIINYKFKKAKNEHKLNQSKSTLNMTFKNDNLQSNFYELPLILQQLRKSKKKYIPENKNDFSSFMKTNMQQLSNYMTVNNFSKKNKKNSNEYESKINNVQKLPSLQVPCKKLANIYKTFDKSKNLSQIDIKIKEKEYQKMEENKDSSVICNKAIKKIFSKSIPKLKLSLLGGCNFSKDLQNFFK